DIGGQPLPVWDTAEVGNDGDPSWAGKPTLVFLHGWGLAPPAYRDLLTALAGPYRIIAPYIPGLCWNRPVRRYGSHGELAALIIALIDQKQLGTVHIAGQSTGGGIAAMVAADAPDRVASLTLIDASGLPLLSAQYPALARVRELVAEAATYGVTRPGLAMARSFGTNVVRGRGALIRTADIPLRENLSASFACIKAPTLILWGELDLLFPVAAGHAMGRLIPGARLQIVPGGWHSWEINRHAEAAALITRHVDTASKLRSAALAPPSQGEQCNDGQ
ncbi:MAG: alpha/beta fold hydrolase, partial [Phycisphaerales bacterium]|nr:alpha/beta fold hydrolase [Phycisphaerales bacterium]